MHAAVLSAYPAFVGVKVEKDEVRQPPIRLGPPLPAHITPPPTPHDMGGAEHEAEDDEERHDLMLDDLDDLEDSEFRITGMNPGTKA